MTVMEITKVVVIKSLWWIIPTILWIVAMAIDDWKEEHR